MNSSSLWKEDSIFRAHSTSALPFFKSWVKQQHDWRNKALSFNTFSQIKEICLPIDNYERELACNQCLFPIINIFVSNTDQNGDDVHGEQTSCMNCFLSAIQSQIPSSNDRDKIRRAKIEKHFIKYRFASTNQLDNLLNTVSQIIEGKLNNKLPEAPSR